MDIKKGQLQTLYSVTRGTEGVLSLKEARTRDLFFKEVGEHTKVYEGDMQKIYEKFCKKNEDGNPDLSDGKYHFEKDVVIDVNKELEELFVEDVKIKIDFPITREQVKEILEKTEYKPKAGETETIDALLALL